MDSEKKAKRIVSKGEYVKIQSTRLGLNITSFCLLLLAISAALFALSFMACLALSLLNLFSWAYIALLALEVVIIGAGVLFTLLLIKSVDKTKSLEEVVLATRANTADLPASDSLVRAGEKPEQVQADVLLRPATEVQYTPPEQLLRASVETKN